MRSIILIVILTTPFVVTKSSNQTKILSLTILHNNDMHGRFEQTDHLSGICKLNDALAKNCFGGFARVSSVIKQHRKEAKNGGNPVLYLNAGDTYVGSKWFTLFKDKIVSEFMNILRPDAMCLGNHEFEYGLDALLPFLNNITFPVVIANLNTTANHSLWQTRSLKKSTIFNIKGFKIGVIGYLTNDTKSVVGGNVLADVDFLPEISSINKEAEVLKQNGINIIIALGHSGLSIDKQIAKYCPLVDVVIGGHSHTFLYSGDSQHAMDDIKGPYPTIIIQKNGKVVPVVQAYAFTKYMGKMELTFDQKGNLIQYTGQPILLNHKIEQDQEVLAIEAIYRSKVDKIHNEVYGVTKFTLDGSNCRYYECNIGNMITDSMVWLHQLNASSFTNASVAFLGSGDIRSSIKRGIITDNDLDMALPYPNKIVAAYVTGNVIRKMLEHSVHRYSDIIGRGEFLQMSGLHVTFDITKNPGMRVVSVSILCSRCIVPAYEELQSNRQYGVLMTSYIYEGGDGYNMLNNLDGYYLDKTVPDAVRKYIKSSQTVHPTHEDRIKFVKYQNEI